MSFVLGNFVGNSIKRCTYWPIPTFVRAMPHRFLIFPPPEDSPLTDPIPACFRFSGSFFPTFSACIWAFFFIARTWIFPFCSSRKTLSLFASSSFLCPSIFTLSTIFLSSLTSSISPFKNLVHSLKFSLFYSSHSLVLFSLEHQFQ